MIDPALVRRMLARARATDPLAPLTPREREVLALMAEGRSNTAIARSSAGLKTVETHINRVFAKLGFTEDVDGHRRVLAVLAYLRGADPDPGSGPAPTTRGHLGRNARS